MRKRMSGVILGLAIATSAAVSVQAAEKIELHGYDQQVVDRLRIRGIRKEPSTISPLKVGEKKPYLHSFRGDSLDLGSENSFHAVRESTDSAKVKHTRYRQLYKNIPVFGKELVLHEDQNGNLSGINGSIVKGIEPEMGAVSLTPAYTPAEALDYAKSLLSQGALPSLRPRSILGKKTVAPTSGQYRFRNSHSELNIYVDGGGRPRLVYYVNFYAEPLNGGEPIRPYLLMDAKTREIVKQWEGLTHQLIGTGPGGNEKVGRYEYGTKNDYLDVMQNGVSCSLENASVSTVDMTGRFYGYAVPFSYTCPRNTVKNINGAYSPLNDAHYFGGVIVNMYMKWYGVPPIPLPLLILMHYETNYENALWDGRYAIFGDGGSTFYPLSSLDFVAHEVSHGFTEFNSGLVYNSESGGINESFSDMAGEAAKYFMRGNNDWQVAGDIMKSAAALRYMNNPPLDGVSIDHYSKYYDGLDVHFSSGLFNKAFYLLATRPGWNTKMAFDVMFKANKDYWVPESTFRSAACGVVSAARDLSYNSADVNSVFGVVGVNCLIAPQNVHTLKVQ